MSPGTALEPMNDPDRKPVDPPAAPGPPVLFATESRITRGGGAAGNGERNWVPWIIATLVILFLAGLAFIFVNHDTSASSASTLDRYAANLVFSNLHLTQTGNFAGDQLTYLDGTISNRGDRTVTSITVRVLFASDTGDPPQAEQVPLNLVRVRQPFLETEPVGASPLKPGATRAFRLIFDDVSPDWNRQNPEMRVQSLAFLHP